MLLTDARAARREVMQKSLAQRAGPSPDAHAVAAAATSTWQQVAGQIGPVIGVHGFDVLFGRSLHLATATFPWLSPARDVANATALLASVTACLEAADAATAAEASLALLVTFAEVLATLIGEPLTERLLSPVWLAAAQASQREIAS